MSATLDKQAVSELTELDWTLALSHAVHSRQQHAPLPARDVDRATPATIPSERLRLASANIRYLSAIIRQLVELRNETEENDEYGTLRPSKHTFDTACHLLTDAAIVSARAGRQIPQGCASTDSEGGIHVEWMRPTAGVSLVVPASADREAYIYHEVGKNCASESATAEALARWLGEIK
jgi:hypothetical protein